MSALPDESGHFGRFGGRMMPEALMAALDELTVAWQDAMADPEFTAEFDRMLTRFYEISGLDEQGQPTGDWGARLRELVG